MQRPTLSPDLTAEELVAALEAIPILELGQHDAAMAGLVRAALNLEEIISEHDAGLGRAKALLIRVQCLIYLMREVQPGRWDATDVQEATPAPAAPNTPARDGPPEG